MFHRYGSFLFWMLGALIIITAFYAATARLWKATEESRATSLENNIVSAAMGDIAEGNLIRFGSTLSKLQRDGQVEFAQILHVGTDARVLFQTAGQVPTDESTLASFNCRSPRKFFKPSGGDIGIVTVLPTRISGGQCDVLQIAAEMPEDLRRFKDRLATTLTFFIAAILGFFSFVSIVWHRRVLQLEIQNSLIHAERDAAIGRIAAQVAHDIQSPLAALEVVQGDITQLPEDKRLLIQSAINRINDIANSLLDRQRALAPAHETEASPQYLVPLIEPTIGEKRLQFRSLTHVKIETRIGDSTSGASAAVQPIQFKRLLSNLINNAVEALDSRGGTVTVRLSATNGRVQIVVQDDGKGIPPDILAKLGRRGESHGKTGGTGLGLHHALTTTESWGGKLSIESKVGQGTTVTVDLPRTASGTPPEGRCDAVLIDDDPLTQMTWKVAASRSKKRLSAFTTLSAFLNAARSIGRDTPIYVDAELGDGMNGAQESIRIRELGFDKIYLATGHPASVFTGFPHLSGIVGKEPPWDDIAPKNEA